MKIGRVIGSIFAVILFCVGMGIYSVHTSLKHVVSDQLIGSTIDELVDTAIASGTDIILKDMPEEVREQVPSEIIALLPKEVQSEMESVKEEIASDPQVIALTEKYMEALISGSANENANMPDVNKDVEAVIETNLPKIAKAAGTEITKEEVSELAQEVASKIDAQTLFDKGMNVVRSSITPQQQTMLATVSFIQSSQCFIISIAFMIVAVGIIALLKKSFYKWMPTIATTSILGGIIVLIVATFAKMFIEKATEGLNAVIGSAGEGILTSIFQSGMHFTIIGVLLLLVYFVIRFITNRVVYE